MKTGESWAIVVAAGKGLRVGAQMNKVLLPLEGKPVIAWTLSAFETCGVIDGVVLVVAQEEQEQLRSICQQHHFTKAHHIVVGGATRKQSVYHGLCALPPACDVVLVHDGARPFVSQSILIACQRSARIFGSGVAAVRVKDATHQVDENQRIEETLDRSTLWAMQTPQAFSVALLKKAYDQIEAETIDEVTLVRALNERVQLVEGEYQNMKITTKDDLDIAHAIIHQQEGREKQLMRVGHGYDVHRLVEGRPLVLCGVEIPYEKGLLGHSDADVALHALIDALLGAAALGDIGKHFPDTDARYKGISSLVLLAQVCTMLNDQGFSPYNIDLTIVAQAPKLMPYYEKMRNSIAGALELPPDRVSVKAKTTEGLGFCGTGEGIEAHAVVTLMC